MAQRKIGILGGTFDPIHLGHLAIVKEIRRKLDLEEVLFVPVGQPVFKEDRQISDGQHRLEMVILATADTPFFNVATVELERQGSSYTIDTIKELMIQLGDRIDLYLIVGFDALHDLPNWKEPIQLLQLCQIIAAKRPRHTELDIRSLESQVPGASERIKIIDVPQVDLSATEIRKKVASGKEIIDLVPAAVASYIERNGLYLEGG